LQKELKELLISGAEGFGVPLDKEKVESFGIYLRELKHWNRKINLTSLVEDKEIIIKHFLDSLTPLKYIAKQSFILDLGSGGGFPGIPLKIAEPSLKVVLLESSKKKNSFLNHIISVLSLKGITAIKQRAESKDFQLLMNETFDVVIARAFAGLEELLKMGSPYLKKGGMLVAMRGRKIKEELEGCGKALKENKLKLDQLAELSLPEKQGERGVVFLNRL
jgi:16S rRNA (guanine527-N7)-methyltransferase